MGKLTALFFQRTASLVTIEYACACFIFTSFNDFLSFVCVDPKYLKWSTSSSIFTFIHMLVDGLGLMLLTTILHLSELISMPYPEAVSSLFQWVAGVLLHYFPADRCHLQTANCKLQSGCSLMDTDDSGMSVSSGSSTASPAKQSFSDGCWAIKVFCIIFSRNTLNSTGDNGHPN